MQQVRVGNIIKYNDELDDYWGIVLQIISEQGRDDRYIIHVLDAAFNSFGTMYDRCDAAWSA